MILYFLLVKILQHTIKNIPKNCNVSDVNLMSRELITAKFITIFLRFNKKVLNNKFWKFPNFFTVYNVQGAVVGGNFPPSGVFSTDIKCLRTWADLPSRHHDRDKRCEMKRQHFILLLFHQMYIITLDRRGRLLVPGNCEALSRAVC